MKLGKLAAIGAIGAIGAVAACGTGTGQEAAPAGNDDGRGPITLTELKTNEEATQKVVDAWNAAHPEEEVELYILPEGADDQRQQLINNAQTKSGAFDVLLVDAVWTAEFAANRWIDPLPEDRLGEFLAPAAETGMYRDKLYTMPLLTGTGLLYYRKDLVKEPPTTWREMEKICDRVLPGRKGMSCFAGQFEKYEGLTVNFSEAVHSAGGQVVDDAGRPALNTEAARAGLEFLTEGFESGMIPKDAITFLEEENRGAFQSGKLLFARNWAYMYGIANAKDSELAGKVGVAPLPGLDGPGAGTLGGNNLAVSAFSEHKATARDFIDFFTSAAQQKTWALENATPLAHRSLYEDEELIDEYPYLPALKDGILAAKPRPVAVKYGDVTAAIQDAVYPALSGDKTAQEALAELQQGLPGLLDK